MKKDLEIRTLTERFFDGKTTLAEERRLYQLYSEAESLPADLAPLSEMMGDMEFLYQQTHPLPLPQREGSNFSPNIEVQQVGLSTPRPAREGQGGGSAPRFLALAASLLLFFTLGSMWYGYQRQNECVAYVYGERVTDQDLVMQEMQTAMVSLTTDDATATMEQQMKELFSE